MPLEIIVYVTFVLSAFALVTSTLAYAQGAARRASDRSRVPAHFALEACCSRNDAEPVRKAA